MVEHQSHYLLVNGMSLFILGLVNGLVIPLFKNKRMGLSAHLAGVQSGMVLLLFGFLWTHLSLPAILLSASYWLSLYSMYAIWLALLLAAIWGSSRSTPIAGAGFQASKRQEQIVQLLLVSGSLAIIAASGALLWGLLERPYA
nr:unknown [uncultured bacterium]